jgi:transposase
VLETVLGWPAPVGQPAAVALEATLYWAWLHDRLTAAGYRVAVAHPQRVKLICHARRKTDAVNARKFADLLRTNLLLRFGSRMPRPGRGARCCEGAPGWCGCGRG